jgi:hypothetical protein
VIRDYLRAEAAPERPAQLNGADRWAAVFLPAPAAHAQLGQKAVRRSPKRRARDLPGAGGTALTASTMVVGIPACMSPEQASRRGDGA